jgi:hypothetical protein
MISRTAADRLPSTDAVEFVRFCYRRRRVGWPELYDEMCAVASRGLFRGWGSDELASEGIGFGLFELPALATLVGQVVAEEHEKRARLTAIEIKPVRSNPEPADQAPADERPGTTPTEAGPTAPHRQALRLVAATA